MSSVAIVDPEQLRARAPRRRLTVADYHRMGDAGILHEDDRIELIDGELFQMASDWDSAYGRRHPTDVDVRSARCRSIPDLHSELDRDPAFQ